MLHIAGEMRMARKAFTDHPEFLPATHRASEAITEAMRRFCVSGVPEHTSEFDVRLNRIADDLKRLLLSMYDKKRSKLVAAE